MYHEHRIGTDLACRYLEIFCLARSLEKQYIQRVRALVDNYAAITQHSEEPFLSRNKIEHKSRAEISS